MQIALQSGTCSTYKIYQISQNHLVAWKLVTQNIDLIQMYEDFSLNVDIYDSQGIII
jgi:hypothetical protein